MIFMIIVLTGVLIYYGIVTVGLEIVDAIHGLARNVDDLVITLQRTR